jgi:hypothetical protein
MRRLSRKCTGTVVGEPGERMADQIGQEIDHPEGLRRDDTDRTDGDEQRALDPDPDQRDDQCDVAEIEEVGRPVVAQIDWNQHGHEGRIGEVEPQRNAARRWHNGWRTGRAHDGVGHMSLFHGWLPLLLVYLVGSSAMTGARCRPGP